MWNIPFISESNFIEHIKKTMYKNDEQLVLNEGSYSNWEEIVNHEVYHTSENLIKQKKHVFIKISSHI